MVQNNTSRSIIALLTCLMLGCAFVAVPFVHKHSLTEQVPLKDYDASCFFVKAEKSFAGGPSQVLVACVGLLLLFMALQPLVQRCPDTAAPTRSIFTRTVQSPRAPPAR